MEMWTRTARLGLGIGTAVALGTIGHLAWNAPSAPWRIAVAGCAAVGAIVCLAAVAIERHDRVSRRETLRTQARDAQLDALHQLALEASASTELDRVHLAISRGARAAFGAVGSAVFDLDPDTGAVRLTHRDPHGTADLDVLLPLARWAVAEGRPAASLEARDGTSPSRRGDERHDRVAMAAPLLVEGRASGSVAVVRNGPSPANDRELRRLETLASIASTAIEAARRQHLAVRDSLTGLFVRDYFFRRVAEEYARAKRYEVAFGLLMIDLDNFKAINDRHGHPVGDRYLAAVGATVQARLRDADLACRYGGDELCVLLPETDLEGASIIANRLRAALAATIVEADGVSLQTTASVGLAAFPEHDSGDLASLLRRADEALYRAKRGGRNRVVSCAAAPRRVVAPPTARVEAGGRRSPR